MLFRGVEALAFREINDKLLNVMRRELVHSDMTKSFVNARCHVLVACDSTGFQTNVCILLEPLLGEVLEFYRADGVAAHTVFLEHECLTLQFFLDLFFRHARLRLPRFVLADLLAVCVIAARDLYTIRVSSFAY